MIFYFIKRKHLPNFNKVLLVCIAVLLLSITFFLSTVKDNSKIPIISNINVLLTSKLGLKDKYFLSQRREYFYQAYQSIREKPLFGVGPNNFYYASVKFQNSPEFWSDSAHNIFLDVLSENGIPVGIISSAIFLLFLAHIKNTFQKQDIIVISLLLGLFLQFQMDYIYKLYSFFILSIFFMGLLYIEGKMMVVSLKKILILSSMLSLLTISILLNLFFTSNGKYTIAYLFYPLRRETSEGLIDQKLSVKDNPDGLRMLNRYDTIFSGDASVQRNIGDIYADIDMPSLSVRHYMNAYKLDKFKNLDLLYTIYDLNRVTNQEKIGRAFLDRSFHEFSQNSYKTNVPLSYRIEVMKACQKVYSLHCPYDL